MSIFENMKNILLLNSVFNRSLSSTSIIILCVMFMVVFDNHAFWSSLFSIIELSDPGMYTFVFACFAFIFSVTFIFFAIFGVGNAIIYVPNYNTAQPIDSNRLVLNLYFTN